MKIEGHCDNTDCESPNLIQLLGHITLHKEFNKDKCWWCKDCQIRDRGMIY